MSQRRKTPLDLDPIQPQRCSIQLRLEILGKVPFFGSLKQKELEQVNRLFVDRGYLPDEAIYSAGDSAVRLYVVADGRVKLVNHTTAGKDVLLDILSPGEFFGSLSILENDEYTETALALSAACVLSVGRADFQKILNTYPAVALSVLEITNRRLRAAQEMMRQLSVQAVEKRIAFVLLKLAEKLGEEQEIGLLIQVPLSRDDLAQMTGTTTETASRIMSQFQKEGIIRTGRQWVAIVAPHSLQALIQEV